ncbi:MAG: S8 family serine peptidase [Defluviitaleaceae bacterium]|nr:S8 family serine peptidase [Defluviitaleaceae bacterium]
MLKVAFIDDGINQGFISEEIPFENYTADETGVREASSITEISHGTMCYQIFRDQAQSSYHLISIKVLDNTTGTGNHKSLLIALKWCANQNIDIINMSMGTRQYADFSSIARAIEELSQTVIIAACSNSNNLTFPACLPNVIGVRHSNHPELIDNYMYIDNPHDQIEIMINADSIPVSIDTNGNIYNNFNPKCRIEIAMFSENVSTESDINRHSQLKSLYMGASNSFATPIITARVFEYMTLDCRTKEDIMIYLRNNGIKNTNIITYELYKSLLLAWEDVKVPIILLPSFTREVTNKLIALTNIFVEDGYRAIALSQEKYSSPKDLLYSLTWNGDIPITIPELIELYYNFALPDIIFLQMEIADLTALPDNMQPDLILRTQEVRDIDIIAWDKKCVLYYGESVEGLFSQIKQLLI